MTNFIAAYDRSHPQILTKNTGTNFREAVTEKKLEKQKSRHLAMNGIFIHIKGKIEFDFRLVPALNFPLHHYQCDAGYVRTAFLLFWPGIHRSM
jgi:hypothetical protein